MEFKFNNADTLWEGSRTEIGTLDLNYNIFDYKQISFVMKYSGGLYSPEHKSLFVDFIKTNKYSETTGQGNEYYFENFSANGKGYGVAFYVRPSGNEIIISHIDKCEITHIIATK